MVLDFRSLSIDVEGISLFLKDILSIAKAQAKKFIHWLVDNPDKVLMLSLALAKAYAGEYQQLLDFLILVA